MVVAKQHQATDTLAENLVRALKANGKHKTLNQAQQHGQIAAVLNDFGAATLFAGQLAQLGPDGSEQLNDNGGADVGHDAQRANRTVFEGTTRKQVVHSQQAPTSVGLAVVIIGQRLAGQAGDSNERNQPADR